MKISNNVANWIYKMVIVFCDRTLAISYAKSKATNTNLTIEEYIKEYNAALEYISKNSMEYKVNQIRTK